MRRWMWIFLALGVLVSSKTLQAAPLQMHIAEGFLPVGWAVFWFVIAAPFWVISFRRVQQVTQENSETRLLLALSAAFSFVLSSLKIPSVTGSSSHPTGTGLGAMLFGPMVMPVLGTIVLLFQAILLAHGGLTTLGANAFSMAIAGPLLGYAVFRGLKNQSRDAAVFLGAALANLTAYFVTSVQLGLAFPSDIGILASIIKFLGIFAITQIPLAISEGILTVIIVRALAKQNPAELARTHLAT